MMDELVNGMDLDAFATQQAKMNGEGAAEDEDEEE